MNLPSDELNFQRLLHRCKKLSRDSLSENKFKLQSAVECLEVYYMKLQDDKHIDSDVLMQYGRELHNLKTLIEVARQKTTEEKLDAISNLPKTFPGEGQEIRNRKKADVSESEVRETVEEELKLEEKISNAVIRGQNEAIYKADIRRQLLSGSKSTYDNEKQKTQNDVDFVADQEQQQQQLSDELLRLTTALKDNVKVAGKVIVEDNQIITEMQAVADQNRQDLGKEAQRLSYYANRSCFDCMMLMLVLLVVWVFLATVVVMKFFGKRI